MGSVRTKSACSSLSITPPTELVASEADTLFSPGIITPGHTFSSAFKVQQQSKDIPPLPDSSRQQQPTCTFFPWQRKDKKPE